MSRNPGRVVTAPIGTDISAKSWLTEAPLRMLMNNLDPVVAERPEDLVVYGGIGKAARNWECFDAIVDTLRQLNVFPAWKRLLVKKATSGTIPMSIGSIG